MKNDSSKLALLFQFCKIKKTNVISPDKTVQVEFDQWNPERPIVSEGAEMMITLKGMCYKSRCSVKIIQFKFLIPFTDCPMIEYLLPTGTYCKLYIHIQE